MEIINNDPGDWTPEMRGWDEIEPLTEKELAAINSLWALLGLQQAKIYLALKHLSGRPKFVMHGRSPERYDEQRSEDWLADINAEHPWEALFLQQAFELVPRLMKTCQLLMRQSAGVEKVAGESSQGTARPRRDPILPEMYSLQSQALERVGWDNYAAARQLIMVTRDLLEEKRADDGFVPGEEGNCTFLPGPIELMGAIECLKCAEGGLARLQKDVRAEEAPAKEAAS
jgi:hypothetical protein